MATSVETLGVDLRPRPKQVGEKARGKQCDVGFSVIGENRVFQENYRRIGVRKLLRTGFVLARAWEGQAVGIAPTERMKVRRQMAAAAGKKESVSLSLFTEVINLEVEEELSTMATHAWAEGVRLGKMEKRAPEGLEEADLRSTDLETSGEDRPERSGARPPDLGTKWPKCQHTLLFEGQVPVDMRVACPQDVKKMPLNQARLVSWKKWAAKHEREELKEGV